MRGRKIRLQLCVGGVLLTSAPTAQENTDGHRCWGTKRIASTVHVSLFGVLLAPALAWLRSVFICGFSFPQLPGFGLLTHRLEAVALS